MVQQSSTYHLLVVDDDQLIVDSLRLLLPKNWSLTAVSEMAQFKDHLKTPHLYHEAFVDMHLTKDIKFAEGPKIIDELHRKMPQLEIIAMSGDLSLDLMEACLKNGAQRFLAKPLLAEEIS